MLVGQEVLGQFRPANGSPDEAEPSQAAFEAIPVHWVAAEHAGQRPERDGELAEQQRAWDVVGAGGRVRHEERGPDAVGGAILEDQASDGDLLLEREAIILEAISRGEAGGK